MNLLRSCRRIRRNTFRESRRRRPTQGGPLLSIIVALVTAGSAVAPAIADFDLHGYIEHLDQTHDLDADGLLRAHEPLGPYRFSIAEQDDEPAYLEEINEWLQLTDGERSLLEKHGFVVSERWRIDSFGGAYTEVWMRDLPVFISTDAILHAIHKSYDDLLAMAERRYLLGELDHVLRQMLMRWPHLNHRYGHDPEMTTSLGDVDVYLTVAYRLLHPNQQQPSQSGNDEMIEEILDFVAQELPVGIQLFNDVPRDYDFSQLRPRGHYVGGDDTPLEDYFRAVMWLGRTEFRLTPPKTMPELDVTREIIDACLLAELAWESGANLGLDRIDEVIRILVGFPDNIALEELGRLTERIELASCASLLEPEVKQAFRSELETGEYSPQLILSQILWGDWRYPEQVRPPYAFLLMGQRFLIDSFITGQVVWPFVEHCPMPVPGCRSMPDPLEVLYCLGNDDALPFMKDEIETFRYAPNLSALRYIIDNQGTDFWHGSLYNSWLQAIRTLAKSGREENVPAFMQTGAWQQEKMNTQLAAWAELRHDNLLYGKQSYTGGWTCSFPCTYVEPIPAFYEALERFAEEAGIAFSGISGLPDHVPAFFEYMRQTMQRLRGIAEKELDGRPFTDEEREFLQEVVYVPPACAGGGAGWYRALYFGSSSYELEGEPGLEPDALIADVHTDPNFAEILHVATGDPELGIFVAEVPGYPLTAFVGPVASYHEHITVGFQRLTDQEWDALYRDQSPARPDWTYVYLADKDGNVREGGRRLVTEPDSSRTPGHSSGSSSDNGQLEPTFLAITPNPSPAGALVSLRLDGEERVPVRLCVIDTRGAVVREIHTGDLPPQLVHFRWDGAAESGRRVDSGIYFLRLEVGNSVTTRKVTILH